MAYYRTLVCDSGHRTEPDFGKFEGFEDSCKRKLLSCACCESKNVTIEPPSTRVNRSDSTSARAENSSRYFGRANENAPYLEVGADFAKAARALYASDESTPNIVGSASDTEMNALVREKIVKFVDPQPARKYNA